MTDDWTRVLTEEDRIEIDTITHIPGEVTMFAGVNLPERALLCDGRTYQAQQYPKLASALGVSSGSFTVPDLRNRFPMGGSSSSDVRRKIEAGLPDLPDHYHDLKCTSWATGGGKGGPGNEFGPNQPRYMGKTNNATYTSGKGLYGRSNTVQPPAVTVNFIIWF